MKKRLAARWATVWPAVCLSGILLASSAFAQTTRYVATTGSDAEGTTGSIEDPWLTISNGVARAAAGDIVLVATGTYAVTVNVLVGKILALRSWNQGAGGGEDRQNTIIDGGGICAPLYTKHAEALVSGFTLKNGNGTGGASPYYGGGVYMDGGTLSNCVISANACANFGGGVYLLNGATVSDCLVQSNRLTSTIVGYGGGAYVSSGCRIFNTAVIANTNLNNGGGIYCAANATVSNCLVAGNRLTHATQSLGGGMAIGGTNVFVLDSVVSNNISPLTGGGVGVTGDGLLNMLGCTVYGNTAKTIGGGIHIMRSLPGRGSVISNCVISHNWCTNAGGVGAGLGEGYTTGTTSSGTLTVAHTRFLENGGTSNDRYGGGAWIYTHGTAVFHNCQFLGNSVNSSSGSGSGGGLYVGTGSVCVVIRNCLVAGNQAMPDGSDGGGIFFGGASGSAAGPVPLQAVVESCTIADNAAENNYGGMNVTDNVSALNCIIAGNTAASYSDIRGDPEHIARFSYSCCPALTNAEYFNFAGLPAFADAANGNYRLQQDSPCINAGMNAPEWMASSLDLDSRARLDRFSGRVDMGGYEHVPDGILFTVR